MNTGVYLTRAEHDRLKYALDFGAAEFGDIHAKLDRIEVPRTVEGEKLSASQRVSVLIGAYKSACTRVGRE